jgi:cytochrome P450
MAQLVTELELPYLDMIGLERHDAIEAVKTARAQHWLARMDMGYSVTRLQDVTAILRDKRFHSALSFVQRQPELADSEWAQSRRQSILTMEGDSHARLRQPAAPDHAHRRGRALRPRGRQGRVRAGCRRL